MSRAAEAAMAASYKSLKENFVSGLTGGEISEINYVTAVAPVRSLSNGMYTVLTYQGCCCSLVSLTVSTIVLQDIYAIGSRC